MDAMSSSVAGIQDGVRRFERASRDLMQSVSGASAPQPRPSPETAIVEQISAENQVRANASTVRAAQQMYGALLDILV
jgi:hypothetical protein